MRACGRLPLVATIAGLSSSPLYCSRVPGRRESALLVEDQFPVVDGADPTAILSLSSIGAAAASMTTPAMDTLNRLILVIRFLLWRQTAGDAALAAGLPGEAVRHYSKGTVLGEREECSQKLLVKALGCQHKGMDGELSCSSWLVILVE